MIKPELIEGLNQLLQPHGFIVVPVPIMTKPSEPAFELGSSGGVLAGTPVPTSVLEPQPEPELSPTAKRRAKLAALLARGKNG